jgi:hypothetical protein
LSTQKRCFLAYGTMNNVMHMSRRSGAFEMVNHMRRPCDYKRSLDENERLAEPPDTGHGCRFLRSVTFDDHSQVSAFPLYAQLIVFLARPPRFGLLACYSIRNAVCQTAQHLPFR